MAGTTDRYLLADGPIELNAGRPTVRVMVANTGDRPIQVGSHVHFFEANRALLFERARAFGMRLNIPAGLAVRFEPGDEREVELVTLGGERHAPGFNGLTNGETTGDAAREAALQRAHAAGFRGARPADQEDP
jgi:urease beta subunit